ncbi:MAG: RpiB/LacA/LacB family sugar-phosphate isomerase [Schwartzia sp.]|nr:RpiB/LacA/LacB family sugar-phosphate isomerase [Schwartzia sp. (in: firmicutes)]
MRIAVIQATSQISKNGLIVDGVKKYASSSEIFNFGCTKDDAHSYSYIEIAVLVGLLLASKSVDFVVTGCSSGQGMMLACNTFCAAMRRPRKTPTFSRRSTTGMRYRFRWGRATPGAGRRILNRPSPGFSRSRLDKAIPKMRGKERSGTQIF